MESKNKTRVSLFLDRDLVETADKIMKERSYRSRNQFYSVLLADAIADEVTDKHKDILGEKFAKAMKAYEEEMKRAISKGLFRYAVHLEMIAKILADHYEYSEYEVDALRHEAYKNIRRLRGKIPFDKILAGYYSEHQIETPLPMEWESEEDF